MKRVTLLVLLLAFTLNAQQKRTLTPEDVVDIRSVADANVSPDGKWIAFVVTEPADSSKPDKARDDDIWIVPTGGSEPAQLFAFSAKRENTPRWSPDDRWLAFLSDHGEDGQAQIWLMRADGGEAEKLTSAKAGVDSYKWSPEGRMIAFLARDAKTDEERRKQQMRDDPIQIDRDYKYERLWVLSLNDRKQVLITRRDMEVRGFDWSPDSASFAIAFTSRPGLRDSDCHMAVVRRSDGKLAKNLADNLNIFGPNVRWSPDGTALLFFESSPSGSGYWMSLIDPNGGQVRPLLKDYVGTFLGKSIGAFLFVWTLHAMGVTAVFSLILSTRTVEPATGPAQVASCPQTISLSIGRQTLWTIDTSEICESSPTSIGSRNGHVRHAAEISSNLLGSHESTADRPHVHDRRLP